MGDPAKRRATYDDLLAVPEHLVAEIIDGNLVTTPRPSSRHARAASVLGGELHGPFDRGRGPISQTLEAYCLRDARWMLLGTWYGDAKVRVAPFEVFELDLAGLWAR